MYTTQGQLIHSLSFLSNAAFDIKADNFPKLQDDTTAIVTQTLKDAGVQGDIGKWDLLWGPIVFSNDRTSKTVVADNTMMLVYNAEQNLFVVAIAGTNAVSTYGFFQEDFGVNNLIDWNVVVPDADKKSGSIAAGTKQGLDILLGMTGPELMIEGTPTGDMVTALSDYMAYLKKQNASFTATNVGFYGPQSRVLRLSLQDNSLNDKLAAFSYNGNVITNLEMETAAIYGLSNLMGHEAISFNAILANRVKGTFSKKPKELVNNLIVKVLEEITSKS